MVKLKRVHKKKPKPANNSINFEINKISVDGYTIGGGKMNEMRFSSSRKSNLVQAAN
jgi:hypothetical protein